MNLGMSVAAQAVDTAKTFRDLYEDEDGDEEELIAMTDSEKEAYERKVRDETVRALLRANHFAQTSRKIALEALPHQGEAYHSKLSESQRTYLKALGELMPEERTRPSILEPTVA